MKVGDLVKLKDFGSAVHSGGLTAMRFYRRLAHALEGKTAIIISEVNHNQSVVIMYENKKHVIPKEFLKPV